MVPASVSAVGSSLTWVEGAWPGARRSQRRGARGTGCTVRALWSACRLAWAGFCRSPAPVCVVQLRTILCTNVLTLTRAHGCRRCRLPPAQHAHPCTPHLNRQAPEQVFGTDTGCGIRSWR